MPRPRGAAYRIIGVENRRSSVRVRYCENGVKLSKRFDTREEADAWVRSFHVHAAAHKASLFKRTNEAAASYVYAIRAGQRVKIGVAKHPHRRLAAMQIGSPVDLELLATLPGGFELEAAIHDALQPYHSHGEWFVVCSESLAILRSLFPLQKAA